MKLVVLILVPLAAAQEPRAAKEQVFSGSVDLGARWNQGIKGSQDAYRSIVNMGEGARLLNWDTSLENSPWKLVRKAQFRGAGWGGDPSAWLQGSVESRRYYRLSVDHRDTAYFNALPSFANPVIERGLWMSQRAFDTHRRFTEVQLDLVPDKRWIPFFGYTHDNGFGRGVSNFVSEINEYPALAQLNDRTHLFRGGLRMESRRAHLTLEQGGILFSDDYRLSNTDGIHYGNRSNAFLGQTLFLSDLLQAYEIQGSSVFTKGYLTLSPADWFDFSGAFQFSQPRNDVTYRQSNRGLFIDLDSLLFFNAQNLRLLAAAQQPHVTANAGAEVRPLRRLRILQSWVTDRLHNASSIVDTPVADRLEWSYHQQQTEVSFEFAPRIVLRGGYRYSWGEGVARAPFVLQLGSERGQLRRHSALAGGAFRFTDRISVHADSEITRSDRVLFRTSLTDYERLRVRGRYQLLNQLLLYGTVQYLSNTNPPQTNPFDFLSRQAAMGVQWSPSGGRTFQLLGEYARSTIRSSLPVLFPPFGDSGRSLYRDNAHTVTGLLSYKMAAGWTWQPQWSLGGSFFRSSGSRPTSFYQPVVRLTAPLMRHVDLIAEYRWYAVSQAFYSFEGFRNHQGFVGIRIH